MNNTGVIFKRALRDSRSAMLWWGVGLAIYAFCIAIIYPFVQGFEGLNTLLENPVMKVILGEDVADLASPGGFLGNYFFLMMPLILAVYNVLYGLGVTAAEEDRGTLDVLLSRPVPRWRLIAEKFAALVVAQFVIVAITLVGFLLGMLLTPSLTVGLGDLILGVLNLLPVTLCITGLTVLLSTLLRSRPAVGGIVAAVLVASYFLNTLSGLMEAPLDNLRFASIFHYYNGGAVLLRGVDWGGFLLLAGIAVGLVALAMPFFQRRDLAA
jgi:ABC-2 type transport system permease protein